MDSKVQQVLEVVLKTKMEERIGGEKLVEVSPNGKRRVLEPQESPYQVRKGNFEKKTCFASKSLPCSDPLSSSAAAFNVENLSYLGYFEIVETLKLYLGIYL